MGGESFRPILLICQFDNLNRSNEAKQEPVQVKKKKQHFEAYIEEFTWQIKTSVLFHRKKKMCNEINRYR